MSTWHQFYQTVRDPSWPDCATEDSYPLLPDFIRQECETVHGYVPGSFKANRQPLIVNPISPVPESILNAAIAEIDNIDWTQTQTDSYIQTYQAIKWPGKVNVDYQGAGNFTLNQENFVNKTLPIFLRTHKAALDDNTIDWDNYHKNVDLLETEWHNYYKNVDSVDTEWQVRLPGVTKLLHWTQQKMNAKAVGNSVLNCMLPGGNVHLHIDKGRYFDHYCRFHIPLQTNSQVIFSGLYKTPEHMPLGWLYRLNNLLHHQVQNQGTTQRVHLIIDLLLDQPNSTFDTTELQPHGLFGGDE